MAQISLEEAIRLGLVPEEEVARLAQMGVLGSPFARSGGAGQSPFWRLPSMSRGGLYAPRFGLGPLSQGLALSPPAPAISGGGVPVGRRAGHSQGPADLDTLIGSGDVNEIARRVASGQVDPNMLPAGLRAQVMSMLQAPRHEDQREGPAAGGAKEMALAKQVLSVAKTLLPKGGGAAKIIDQTAQENLGEPLAETGQGEPAASGGPAIAQSGPGQNLQIPQPGGGSADLLPAGQDQRTRLEALGFSPDQIAQMLNQPLPNGAVPVGRITINGGETESFPLTPGAGTGDLLFSNGQGGFEAAPPELMRAIQSGVLTLGDAKALSNEGYSAAQIMDAMRQIGGGGETPIDEFGAGIDPTPVGGGAAGGGAQVPGSGLGQVAGGALGAMTIAQAINNPNYNPAQKAFASAGGASQIAAAGAPLVGAEAAVPYLAGAASLANIGLTATGPGPSDQKAAYAAIDAAAAAVATGLALTGYGAILSPFVPVVSSLVKQWVAKSFPLTHAQREALEAKRTGGFTQHILDQIQATKSEAELYDLLRAWSPPTYGGASAPNSAPGGLDPMPINVAVRGGGEPDWDFLGQAGGGGVINPNAPTPKQFFDRVLQNPDALQVQVMAGIKPEMLAPMNEALQNSIKEQVGELRVREYVQPNVMSFSRMAGVLVSEDDIVDALRKTRGVIDSPDFVGFLRQAERDRVGREATAAAMANQPFLPAAKWSTQPGMTEEGQQERWIQGVRGMHPDQAPVSPGDPEYDAANEEARMRAEQKRSEGYYEVQIPDRTYRATTGGWAFQPGVGWVDAQGNVGLATGPLPDPTPWSEPTPAPQPASTATPPSAPAGAPGSGQSAVPATSPLAPPPPENPGVLGIMHQGGVVPRTGPYQLEQGETVIPAHGRLQNWIEDGRALQSTTQPQPSLRNPRLMWIQDEENQWHEVDPNDYPAAGREHDPTADEGGEPMFDQESALPEGRYYLDPKRGVPFAESKNPDAHKTWRLVFDPNELPEAWKNRVKDGSPLLVPPSVLKRPDWADVVERARQSQYVSVHPAILLARQESDQGNVRGGGSGDFIETDRDHDMDNPEAIRRFWNGTELDQSPLPESEKVGPMREIPGRRPMTPDERQQIDWGGRHA